MRGSPLKWFKHYSDASEDDFIENLEEIFGLEGYARWWKLLEKIAIKMDETDNCSAEHSWIKWQSFLKGKRNKLETFLKHCQNEGKIKLEQTGNILKITCPKLLELRDKYTKDLSASGKKPDKKLTPKNQDPKNQEKDIKDQEDILNVKKDFNVDLFLTDIDRMCIKSEAPGWDLQALIVTFNTYVKKKEIPKHPSAAFLAWTIKFTKGKGP